MQTVSSETHQQLIAVKRQQKGLNSRPSPHTSPCDCCCSACILSNALNQINYWKQKHSPVSLSHSFHVTIFYLTLFTFSVLLLVFGLEENSDVCRQNQFDKMLGRSHNRHLPIVAGSKTNRWKEMVDKLTLSPLDPGSLCMSDAATTTTLSVNYNRILCVWPQTTWAVAFFYPGTQSVI